MRFARRTSTLTCPSGILSRKRARNSICASRGITSWFPGCAENDGLVQRMMAVY